MVKDPTLEPEEFSPKTAHIWRNMNAFGARCLGAGVLGAYWEAMYAMRSALEDEQTGKKEHECRVQVACEWISHASKPLLWWAQENIGYADVPVEDKAAYVEQGPLYSGPASMCLQRWGFWLDRFEELSKEESGLGEEIRKAALEASQTMKSIEAGVAHTLSAAS